MQNPDHWLCLSLLATLHLNAARQDPAASTAKTDVVKGVELLKQAQKINKDAPSVLIQLADVLFQKGETQKSAAAAQKALNYLQNEPFHCYGRYVCQWTHDICGTSRCFHATRLKSLPLSRASLKWRDLLYSDGLQ